MEPVIIINCKAYERGTAEDAEALARLCAARGAWIAVQATDIDRCARTGARVLAQHVDPVTYGSHTGSILPEAVKRSGGWGTLLNHSERRLDADNIPTTIQRCKQAGLAVVLCAESVEEAERFKGFGADFLAVELPELIGGDVSIVDADPQIVAQAVNTLGANVLVGAGVSSGEDVKQSLESGATGVLVASAVVSKPADQAAALDELYSTTR